MWVVARARLTRRPKGQDSQSGAHAQRVTRHQEGRLDTGKVYPLGGEASPWDEKLLGRGGGGVASAGETKQQRGQQAVCADRTRGPPGRMLKADHGRCRPELSRPQYGD